MNNILLFEQKCTRAKSPEPAETEKIKKEKIFDYKYLKVRLLGRMNVPTPKIKCLRLALLVSKWPKDFATSSPNITELCVRARGAIIYLKYFKRKVLDTLDTFRANEFIKTE